MLIFVRNAKTNAMNIIESYYLSETETLLVDEKNNSYFVAYNVIKEEIKGLGFIDYDTPPDNGETITEVEMLDYFKCNEDLEKIGDISDKDLQDIEYYLTSINNY